MTKNKKKLRRAERRYSVTKSAQTLVLAGMLLAGGVSGAMAADVAADASTAGTGDVLVNGTTYTGGTGGLLTITGTDVAFKAGGDITISGAHGLQIGKDTPDAAAKLTVGTAASEKLIINNALTLSGIATNTATLDLSANSALVNLITADDNAPFTITSKGTGASNNVISVTNGTLAAYKANGSTVTGLTLDGPMTVTVNAGNGNLLATDMVLSGGAIVSNTKLIGIDGDSAGTATSHKSLTITGTDSKYTTTALALTNGGAVTLSDGGELATATTITGGELNLSGGSTHTGAVDMNGTAADDAKLNVTGGTKDTPNIITGAITTTNSNASGIITVGDAENAAFLNVTGASTIGNGATGASVNMDIVNGAALFSNNGTALTIGEGGTVKASNVNLGTKTTFASGDAGLYADRLAISDGGTLHVAGSLELAAAKLLGTVAAAGDLGLADGGTLRVDDTLTLTSGSDVTTTFAGDVIANVLNVQDSTTATTKHGIKLNVATGTLTLLGDDAGTFLNASKVELDNGGTLNLGTIAEGYTTNGGTYTGAIATTNGTINVAAGEWTINNVTAGTTTATGLNLGGNGTLTVANDAKLDLNLGAANTLTVGKAGGLALSDNAVMNITGNLTAGIADSLHMTGGTLTVSGLTDLSGGTITSFTGGTLQTNTLKATTTASTIGGGTTSQAILKVTDTSTSAVINTGNVLKLDNLGTLEMAYNAAVNAGNTAIGILDSAGKTGVLKLTNGPDSITLAAYQALKPKLINGGALRLEGTQITDVPANTAVTTLDGIAVPDADATFANGNTLSQSGTEVKSLTANVAGNVNLTIANAGASLSVAGGTSLSDNLIKNEHANAGTTTLAVNNGATLNFGLIGGETDTKGTAKANVTLNGGTFQAVNGEFKLAGTVADGGNANGKVTVLDGDKLDTEGITLTGTGSTLNVGAEGGLTASKGNISTTASALDGGTLSATDEATGKGNLTIGTLTTSANGGTVSAFKDLNITNTTLAGNTNMLAGSNLTVGAILSATDDAALLMNAGGNVAAGANDIETAKGGLSITAKDGTITAGDISAGEGKAQLILNAGKAITAADIQGGDNSSIKAASLTADALNLAGGEFNLSDTKATSTLNGALTLGSTDDNLSFVAGDVKGTLDLKAGGSLVGGSSLKVNELKLTGTMNVGSNVEKSTGTLSVNKLADGGTIFADPAWIAGTEHSTSYASQVAIAAFDNTANELKSNIVGGQASQIVLGTKDTAWVKNKLDEYNAAYHTNIWGPKAGQVTAALGITKAVTLNGAGLYIDGAPTTDATKANVAGNAHFGENSLLIVDANSVGADTALTAGNINVADKAKLMLTNVTVGTEYSVAKATTGLTIGEGSWDGANILTDHRLLTGVLNTKDKEALVTINQRSATSVLPGLSSEMGGLIDNMIKQNHVSENSPHAGVRFANRAINRLNGDQAAATIEGAAQLAVVGAAPAMTLSAVQAGTSTVTTRTSFASPLMDSSKAVALHKDVDGTLSVDSGLNAGNGMKNGFGLWIMPLYQSNSAWGMKADGFKGGYKSDLGGVALGADYTFNDMFRLGLAFNIGGGYAESNGDFNKTENSFNFWGINAYGGWTMNNFGITADVGYTGNYNKLEQELPGAMGMGDIKSDVNSSAWTAGLRGEYKFATEALDIIPHVGVRYTGLTTDEYKAKSGGDTVFKVDQDFQSIWTFPIGVTLAKEIETGSGWIVRPQVDLGITPATGDVKAKSKVRIPGVDGQAEMKMQAVDYMSYDGGVGLEMKKDNVSFGINYNIQASEHRTGHGVFGTFRYEF